MRREFTFIRACALVIGLLGAASLHAQAVCDFDLPAQPLADALRAVGSQTSTNVLFDPPLVEGRQAPALRAQLTANEAFARLLAGTGLKHRFLDEKTITIVSQSSAADTPTLKGEDKVSPSVPAGASRDEGPAGGATGFSDRIRLAQGTESSSSGRRDPATESHRMALSADAVDELGEVVVVASRLGGSALESAQPVRVITRAEIDRSGAAHVSQVLSLLPEVSFSTTGTTTQGLPSSTTIRMRGLPAGTTLVLINGRRIEGSGLQADSGFFNLSNIPLATVERIEVLPTGSSAVYGGDALAGVVNIVLKKGYKGVGASLNYGHADGYDETHASLALGHGWSRASLSVIGTYDRQNELRGSERELSSSMDYRPYGSTDQRLQLGNPGNVFSTTSANLPGLNSTFAAIPAGSTGVGMTPADFDDTAGTLNLSSILADSSVYVPEERQGVLLYGTLDLSAAELFTEVLFARTTFDQYTNHPLLQRVLVPVANPYNPFGAPVRVSVELDSVDRIRVDSSRDYLRPVLGARGRLGDWSWESAAWLSKDSQTNTTYNVPNTTAVTAALASTDPAASPNLFQDGPMGSPALLQSLLTTRVLEYESSLRAADATLRGPLFDLPSGSVDVLFGAEYEDTALEFVKDNATSGVDADRSAYALFSEFKVPLWRKYVDPRMGEALVLSGAVRYDHYSDFGGRTSPGVGLEFRPVGSLLLRAAYGTSFKPPLLFQLYLPNSVTTATVVDPRLGDISYVAEALNGGNPELEPQTGRSTTVGVVVSPHTVPDLDVSLTYWKVRLDNGFITPSTQYLTENEERYPDRVIRDDTGRIALLDRTYFNFGYIDEAGFDFGIDWRVATGAGEFTPALSVTKTQHYEVQDVAGAPPRSAVGVVTAFGVGWAPRWKGLASLGWRRGTLDAAIQARYVDDYRDGGALADGTFKTLGDVWHVDVNAGWGLGGASAADSSGISSARLSLGAVNVFDQQPEFSNVRTGWAYDPSQYDIRGRYVYLQLSADF